ncbi:MAG: MscS Mechanosensitive ion channel [Frankiales bacterium]|nr:MscS Mechanosensitive ion channel [Frankiales bacterium]
MDVLISIAPLTDFSHWASGNGLEIVLLLLGAVLLARVTSWVGERITRRIDQQVTDSDALVRSEASKHRHAVAQVLTYVALVVIYTITGVLVLDRLGVPISGLVAPAAVVGVALGFGAQRVVQDVLAGFFVVTERQYGYGDVIKLTLIGGMAPVTGTVEDVTLRVTRVRTVNGEVVITPNGQVGQVTNLSRDWARAVVDVPLAAGTDVAAVSECLTRVGTEAYDAPELHDLLLDAPSVMGVESLEVDQLSIRMVARTLPGKQFDVGRQLRARVAAALRAEGVHLPAGLDTADPSGLS